VRRTGCGWIMGRQAFTPLSRRAFLPKHDRWLQGEPAMRVLLAEDNSQLATWLAKSLRQKHFAVDWLADGATADQSLSSEDYDAVILDLNLPRMDGLEVLRRLRKRGARTPVLVLTARGSLDERVTGLNAGADDYLAKPFELAELEARLN